ncbi:hypothetical protein SAMN04487906_2448 [Zhouia amylolytica]|uniref:Uncharacterized protein n=2 Tax=Zhouia amylolytica TaxID=376730 RepID=W2UN27_9FLAO|nr:DUF6691 family protein [Zhouia amylolytica]ETN95349.1 hypothetical protein P278_10710 [Zhouia amylolytica AD3]MCQ0112411.1 YeeE/YedE family protein [Zhouia amylolytica]SFT00368.1 hypothetical protein SAMN04487906_2448 [Zhouia amylolytica]
MKRILYIIIGLIFGIVLYKSEAASWFRIYEMFRFESFHMYGIIGTALIFGSFFIWSIKRFKIKSFDGRPITIEPKDSSFRKNLFGGIIFGLGWALVGACPGPLFVLIGAGFAPVLLVLVAAVFGTFLYGILKNKLPH